MVARRSPRGERGLKYHATFAPVVVRCRSPRGERGLKSHEVQSSISREEVAPLAGSVD